jgi:heptosyltransferase-2
MRNIIHAPDVNHPILIPLLPAMMEEAELFAENFGLLDSPVIGLNVGAGHRWQHKKWTVEGFVALAEKIHEELHAKVLILYGPEDTERAQDVFSSLTIPYVDAGLHDSMLEFFAVLNLCDVVVTGDTFALHASLGLGKRVVCFVGPTSAAELELYGQGVILQGKIDCLGCYLTRCNKDPFCMKLLPADEMFHAIKEQLNNV